MVASNLRLQNINKMSVVGRTKLYLVRDSPKNNKKKLLYQSIDNLDFDGPGRLELTLLCIARISIFFIIFIMQITIYTFKLAR